MSDNNIGDPQETSEAAAIKLSQVRETLKAGSDEIFVVQLAIHEEYNDTAASIVSANRSVDGALQAAIGVLVDYGALDQLMEEIDWAEEDVDVLGDQEELYAFMHNAELGPNRIYS